MTMVLVAVEGEEADDGEERTGVSDDHNSAKIGDFGALVKALYMRHKSASFAQYRTIPNRDLNVRI